MSIFNPKNLIISGEVAMIFLASSIFLIHIYFTILVVSVKRDYPYQYINLHLTLTDIIMTLELFCNLILVAFLFGNIKKDKLKLAFFKLILVLILPFIFNLLTTLF